MSSVCARLSRSKELREMLALWMLSLLVVFAVGEKVSQHCYSALILKIH